MVNSRGHREAGERGGADIGDQRALRLGSERCRLDGAKAKALVIVEGWREAT